MSTALENHEPFRSVFSYALMRDEKGQEMHKSKGTAIDFGEAAEKMGVDAMRWVFVIHNPSQNLNFGFTTADEVRRRFLLTLWNTYSFFVTYANIDHFNPITAKDIVPSSEMDRWVLSELHSLIEDVTSSLDNYDAASAGHRIEDFTELLSNWYVRRNRRRFWKSENDHDKLSAHTTLYSCLVTLTKLLAPLTPFISEELYQNLVRTANPDAPESVHLTDYPVPDNAQIDIRLSQAARLAMKIASLGRSARSRAGIKVRQPISKALVSLRSPDELSLLEQVSSQIADELNVKEIIPLINEDEVLDFQVKLNPAIAGVKYGSQMSDIADAIQQADSNIIARQVRAGSSIEVGDLTIIPEEIAVTALDKPGYGSASDAGYLVALVTTISPELKEEGIARELVHRLQNMRREAGFAISDHIVTYYSASPSLADVIRRFNSYIKEETLSLEVIPGVVPASAYADKQSIEGSEIELGVIRAS
jgi:isoleucyl-tRNA synthetase